MVRKTKKQKEVLYLKLSKPHPILGFILGSLGYVAGFLLVAPILRFVLSIGIPPYFKTFDVDLTLTAIAANGIALWVFDYLDKKPIHQLLFSVWLIVIAAMYLAMVLYGRDFYLLWYPVCCGIFNTIVILECCKLIKTDSE